MSNSKTYYIKNGNTFTITDSRNIDIHDHLPAGTYVCLFHPEKGFYLSMIETMPVPPKIYGPTENRVGRIYKTFTTRSRNTGVLLNGEKGAGKTLTLALLSHVFINNGLPVIIINSAFCGDAFNKFISEILQPCMIAFDEFDKTYDDEEQTKILTLLDGVINSNKLFVLTCNDSWKINGFMLNRPGRVFYNLAYRRMEEEAIREYCADVLKNQKHTEGVVAVAATIDAFNFDMLKALIEEMNRYDEPAKDALTMLNIRPERSGSVSYKFLVSRSGNVFYTGDLHPSVSPLGTKPFVIEYEEPNPAYTLAKADEEEELLWGRLILTYKDMIRMDTTGYIFQKDGLDITIAKEEEKPFNYGDYF